MTKEIMKRLTYSFLITLAVSMAYSWTNYESTIGNEGRQGMFILVLITLLLCILNFALSLTALLNINPTVRQNFWTSLLAFLFLPFVLLVVLLLMFLTNENPRETIKDFLTIGHVSILFVALLSFHFYRFRQTLKTGN